VAGYCSLIAVAGLDQWLLYGGAGIWMLTNLPKLEYLPKQNQPRQESEPEKEPEVKQEPVSEPSPPAQASEKDSLAVELPDVDVVLEELLRDFGKSEKSES
jgi:hypothetical protein